MNNEKIGKFLKTRRIEHDLTQENVALFLGVDQAIISRLENGSRPPAIEEFCALAKMYKCTFSISVGPKVVCKAMYHSHEYDLS